MFHMNVLVYTLASIPTYSLRGELKHFGREQKQFCFITIYFNPVGCKLISWLVEERNIKCSYQRINGPMNIILFSVNNYVLVRLLLKKLDCIVMIYFFRLIGSSNIVYRRVITLGPKWERLILEYLQLPGISKIFPIIQYLGSGLLPQRIWPTI